jgi:tetratricopeptide (TPR) repeat protein
MTSRALAVVASLLTLLAGCVKNKNKDKQSAQVLTTAAPTASGVGEVTTILSVKLEPGAGVEVQSGGVWTAQRVGQPITVGATLRTGSGIRARLALRDGSVLHVNEGTQLQLVASRQLALRGGELLAEVTPASSPLVIDTAAGAIRVTGTKLNVKVDGGSTTVDVARGTVEVAGAGRQVEVGAGEQAVIKAGATPRVSLSRDLAEATRWSREVGPLPAAAQSLQPGFGSLEARVPVFGTGGRGSHALRLASQQVRVTMHDNLARTEVEQSWYNGSNDTLEGTYRFPLPEGASISRLALYVGNKLEEGEIVERQRARQIFRKIVEDTIRPRDPALLEWVGGRIFQMKIFPIPPRSARRVILGYTQLLPASHGKYRYVYPMATGQGKAMRVGKFAVDMRVSSGRGLPNVSTPLYPVLTERGNSAVRLRFQASSFTPAASFVVQATPASDPPELQLALYEPAGKAAPARCALEPQAAGQPAGIADIPPARGQTRAKPVAACGDRGGFFMAVLRPELPLQGRSKPRDYLFLLDSSHSTGKAGWAVQLTVLEAFLAEMDVRSRFNVMACDAACKTLGTVFTRPTADSRQAALRFARGITPGGSSNLQAAFEDAATIVGADGSAAHVVYLGDGRPTAGELREPELARLVVARLGKVRATLDALQIGEDVAELFLAQATRRLAGAVHRISAGDDVAARVFDIVSAQYRPTLTDLEVSFEDLDVHHVYPTSLESLTAGSEATIVGRYGKGGQGAIRLRGKLGGAPFERRYPVALAADPSEKSSNLFITRQWAKHHIDALTVESYLQNRAEIVRVSKAYTVLSRATAFLVLENEQMWKEFGITRRQHAKDFSGKVAVRDGRDRPEATPPTATATSDEREKSKGEAGPAEEQSPLGNASGAGAGKRAGADKASDDLDDLRAATPAAKPAAGLREAKARPASGDAPRAAPRRSAPRAKTAPRTPHHDALASRSTMGGGRAGYAYRLPETRVTIQPLLSAPARAGLDRLEQSLRHQLSAAPLRRALHAALHRVLMQQARYDEALRHATQWAELDGDHSAALRALGDAQAVQATAEIAMRTYSSTAEIAPANVRHHRLLAEMYRNKGDLRRSCAHLWSLHSLAPRATDRAVEAAHCLARMPDGRDAAQEVLTDLLAAGKLLGRDATRVAKALTDIRAGAVGPTPRAHGGLLTVQATWNQPIDLDVALITPSGERISALQGGRLGGVLNDSRDGRTAETLRLVAIPGGTYRVEITRPAGSGAEAVTGTVLVQAKGRSQLVPFSIVDGSKPLAQVSVLHLGGYPTHRRFNPRPAQPRRPMLD